MMKYFDKTECRRGGMGNNPGKAKGMNAVQCYLHSASLTLNGTPNHRVYGPWILKWNTSPNRLTILYLDHKTPSALL